MTKQEKFLQLVQTGILFAVSSGGSYHLSSILAVLATAQQVPEEKIPENLSNASTEFLNYSLNRTQCGPRPEWL